MLSLPSFKYFVNPWYIYSHNLLNYQQKCRIMPLVGYIVIVPEFDLTDVTTLLD